MRDWDPWGHLDESDLELIWGRLPHVAGAYVPAHRLIILHPDSTEVSQRSALAEELAHHELGHRPESCPTETARTELRARRWAASRLLTVDQILEAVRWTPYLHEVAELLEVDPDLLAVRVDLFTDEERQLLEERLAGG